MSDRLLLMRSTSLMLLLTVGRLALCCCLQLANSVTELCCVVSIIRKHASEGASEEWL
jgi:hypothetical protein